VKCPSVQAIALQQGTCEKDTDKYKRLERCAAHVVVRAVQIQDRNKPCASQAVGRSPVSGLANQPVTGSLALLWDVDEYLLTRVS
jgi:hypothetical protein